VVPLSLHTLLPSSVIFQYLNVYLPVYEWINPEEKFQKNEIKKRETIRGKRVLIIILLNNLIGKLQKQSAVN